ncbi:MAG: FAD:protein FMN transferase [Anaerolineales bacterium]
METLSFRAMNTSVLLAVDGEAYAAVGLQEARSAIEEFEKRFSRFLPESEISQLNRSQGTWVHVSPELFEMLDLALHYYQQTNGLFDPSILPNLKRLGYDRSMDLLRKQNPRLKHSAPLPRADFATLELDPIQKRVRLPKGMEIDLGGIAKGWIVERSAQLLNRYADVCAVNAGGDILFIGEPLDGFGWDLYLEDPRNPNQSLVPLHVRSGAVATSSITKRAWTQGTESRHHLIDPRTGLPAVSNWLSVTVFGANIVQAEVFAKAILIGGAGAADAILAQHPEIAFLAVDRDGRFAGTERSKEYLYEFEIQPR